MIMFDSVTIKMNLSHLTFFGFSKVQVFQGKGMAYDKRRLSDGEALTFFFSSIFTSFKSHLPIALRLPTTSSSDLPLAMSENEMNLISET